MSAQPLRQSRARRTVENDAVLFDADAARAARLEALGVPFQFLWNGQTFTIPTAKEWPVTVTGALSRGELEEALGILLGEQYDAYMSGNPTMGDIEALMGAVGKQQGLTLPQ